MKIQALLIPLVASSAFVASSSAATMSFGVAQDTTLIQNNNSGDGNFGGRTNVLIGATGAGGQRAGLIEFDVAGFAGQYASITSASITFTIDVTTDATNTYGLRLMQDGNDGWVQGSANGTIEVGAASWNEKINGGDDWLGGFASGARFIPADNYGTIGSMTFTSGTDVNGTVKNVPLDPSSLPAAVDSLTEIFDKWTSGVNPGIQIYGGNGQWSVGSMENATESKRPVLTIEYTPIPEPSGVALLGLGSIGLVLRRRRR